MDHGEKPGDLDHLSPISINFAVPNSPLPIQINQVLRSQPDDIYQFGAEYFEGKMGDNAKEHARRERMETHGEGEGPGTDELMTQETDRVGLVDMSDQELNEFVMEQFLRYDVDGNGTLDRDEFKALLQDAELGLSKKEMRAVMQEADENDDGVLEYAEFVPVMVEIIHGMQARASAVESAEMDAQEARKSVQMHLLHGMPREELENMMRNVFTSADADGSGYLDRKEFQTCLKHAQLGLTRKEINLLSSEVDANEDGMISYEEFTPLCFNILVERFKDDVLVEQAMASSDSLTQLLLEEFEAKEREVFGDASVEEGYSGLLPFESVKDALKALSEEMLGLSKLQLSAVMSESRCDEETDERNVEYTLFAPVAATMIHSMVDLSSQAKRVDAIGKISQTSGAKSLLNKLTMDPDSVKSYIRTAFEAADVDKNGTLDHAEVTTVLRGMSAGELDLSQPEVNAMVAAVDSDQNGMVEYHELVDFLFDVLAHLDREAYIQEIAFNNNGGEG